MDLSVDNKITVLLCEEYQQKLDDNERIKNKHKRNLVGYDSFEDSRAAEKLKENSISGQ